MFCLGQQCVRFDKRLDDRAIGLADFAVGLIDIKPRETFDVRQIAPVIADGFIEFDFVFLAEIEIVLAMAGRDMDKAGTGFGRDEIAAIKRHVVIEIAFAARAAAEGVGADSAFTSRSA